MRKPDRGNSSNHHRGQRNRNMEDEPLTIHDAQSVGEKLNNVSPRGSQERSKKLPSGTATVISIAAHALTAGVTIYLVYLSFKTYSFFSWHPACTAIGFMVLMVQAIMVMSQDNILARSLSRQGRVRAHWIFMTLAAVLIFVGFIVIVVTKNQRGKSHYKTIHAITGLISVILTALTCGGGIVTLYSLQLKRFMKPATLKFGHIVLGIITFLVGIACLITSLFTHFSQREASSYSRGICFVALVLASLLTLVSAVKSAYGRFRSLS